MNRDSHFNTGLLLGALIGAGAALLLAPHSGRKNRKYVSSTLDKAKQTWQTSNGDIKATLETMFNDVSSDTDAQLDKVRAYFDKTLADAKITLAELKEKDLNELIDDTRAYFENSDDTEYNEDWVASLKREWRKANATPATRKSMPNGRQSRKV